MHVAGGPTAVIDSPKRRISIQVPRFLRDGQVP